MRRVGALVVAGLLVAAPAGAQEWVAKRQAVLQMLDKVTARTTPLRAEVGKPLEYGTLAITIGACNARPPGEVQDAAAWLEVTDSRRPGETMFRGWMFANAPAVSMMEHPVYDLRVLDCQ